MLRLSHSIAFLFGITLAAFAPSFFYIYFSVFSFSLLLYKIYFKENSIIYFIIIFCLLGMIWVKKETLFHKHDFSHLKNKMVKARGIITSIPETHQEKSRFDFLIDEINHHPIAPVKTKLTWAYPPSFLRVGTEWECLIGLKEIHSPKNPGSFNYEHWAMAKKIKMQGFVVSSADFEFLKSHPLRYALPRLREKIAIHITNITHSDYSPFLTALTVGLRNGVTSTQWKILQATGTNHLIAIAGLHIGFLCTFTMGFVYFFWRKNKKLILILPAPLATCWSALIVAFLYSALAGFSIPTLRALIMLCVFLIGALCRKQLSKLTSFSVALFFLLVINPLFIFEEGFWLSFASVALILYGLHGRIKPMSAWLQGLKLQWVLSVGLLPLTLLFYQQISLVSFVSNLVAVPFVGWLVLPLCFTGLFFIKNNFLSHFFFYFADKLFQFLWHFLQSMANLSFLQFHLAFSSPVFMITTFISLLLFLSPRGFPCKHLSVLWCLPLFIHYPMLKNNEIKFTVLDVERGQSILIQTLHHHLLFDTGFKKDATHEAGSQFIIPFLRTQKINSLDILLISSNDKLLYGGTQSLVNEFSVKKIISITPELFANASVESCHAGMMWEWDQFQFKMIYPSTEKNENDKAPSCVLLISNSKENIILTGYLSAQGFKNLLEIPLPDSFILITPRYGLTTRSLQNFIRKTSIKTLILSGKSFKNTALFPFEIYDTETHGMISMKILSVTKN